jgi:nucleotide-binding universal stress UspA family protein
MHVRALRLTIAASSLDKRQPTDVKARMWSAEGAPLPAWGHAILGAARGNPRSVQSGKHTAATYHAVGKDGAMSACHNFLIAVDDSEATARAVTYVASIVGRHRGVRLHLFHVAPIPPVFLEFGGSEDVQVEENREAELAQSRLGYLEDLAQAVFARAQAILDRAGVPAGAMETHVLTTVDGEDLIQNLLEAARTNACDTIVVGRQSHSWLRELVQYHVADELVRKGEGFTLWVVE